MTKLAFLDAYKAIIMGYGWAKDPDKLGRFMASVVATIGGTETTTWNFDGPATDTAWRTIGGKGKPTLKALRALT